MMRGRFPAEWEPHDAVLVAWPHDNTDWAPWLKDVEQTYVALVRAILRYTRACVLVRDAALEHRARALLASPRAQANGDLRFYHYGYNDTWLRDSGPITIVESEQPVWLDFRFTGWGGKYAADADDGLVSALQAHADFSHVALRRIDFALEGGAIETDGVGTLLSTWRCLQQRHPDATRAELDALLGQALHCPRALYLEQGELDGDDTDAHIDTLARFASPTCIVYQGCDDRDDPHFAALNAMADELKQLRTADGQPYDCRELPWGGEVRNSAGRRLAASYANFLISSGAVFMPAYGLASDALAAALLAQVFPEHRIECVPCRPLIEQNGSLHCITMQLPRGVLGRTEQRRPSG